MKMIKSEKGITLVELLAGLALLSIILLLASSLHLFAQKQMNAQEHADQSESNVSLAMDIITKEIRSANSSNVTNNVLTVTTSNNATNVYKLNGTALTKNNQTLIADINQFDITSATDHYTITISSNDETPTSLTTTIYFRK
jgi:prepilin-type N-terminal cleavage/methylation domain-containing protein